MSRTTEARAEADVQALDEISPTDAVLFSLKIDDHFDRLGWLQLWTEGQYTELHKAYPQFKLGAWRDPQHEETF